MAITNAMLAQSILDMVNARIQFDAEHQEWLGGTVGGGPFSDGKYLLTNPIDGDQVYVTCPAQMEDDVENLVTGAQGYRDQAAANAGLSATNMLNAQTAETNADAHRVAALAAKVDAENAKTACDNVLVNVLAHEATVLGYTNSAAADAAAAALSEANAALSETNAATSESNAATSASNASTSETNAETSYQNALAALGDYLPLAGGAMTGYLTGYAGTPGNGQVMTWNTANGRAEFAAPAGAVDVSGTPAATQFALWVDADTLQGTADITYDGTTWYFYKDAFRIGAAGLTSNAANLDIRAGISGNPSLRLYQNTTQIAYLQYNDINEDLWLACDDEIDIRPFNTSMLKFSSGLLTATGDLVVTGTIYEAGTELSVLYASAGHNHNTAYADIAHTHSGTYLALTGGVLTGALQTTTVEVGHATDTTLSRLAAAKLGVEGKALLKHAGSYTSGEITVSTGSPSGGSNGDIWLKYA